MLTSMNHWFCRLRQPIAITKTREIGESCKRRLQGRLQNSGSFWHGNFGCKKIGWRFWGMKCPSGAGLKPLL